MSVTMEIEYTGDLNTRATHGPSGASLETDAPTDNGGRGASFSPTDLLATSLASCALTIVGLVAARDGLDVAGMRARVTKTMAAEPTRRVAGLAVTVSWPAAAGLTAAQKKKLAAAGERCPVAVSLSPDIDVTFAWEG